MMIEIAKARFLFVMNTENILLKLEQNHILREQNENTVFYVQHPPSGPAYEILIINHSWFPFKIFSNKSNLLFVLSVFL